MILMKLKKEVTKFKKKLLSPQKRCKILEEISKFHSFDVWRDLKDFIKKSGEYPENEIANLATKIINKSGIEKYGPQNNEWLESDIFIYYLQLHYNYRYINAILANTHYYKDKNRKIELLIIDEFELNNFGVDYIKGSNGFKQSYQNAFNLFHRAANMDIPVSQSNLADMYRDGLYVEKDLNKAAEWYLKSIEKNKPHDRLLHAKINLADIYLISNEKSKQKKAVSLLMELADRDNDGAEAQYQLSLLYKEGKYVEKDEEKRLQYLHMAIKLHYPPALNEYGQLLQANNIATHAIKFFKGAANQGNLEAINNLGVAYLKGIGVQKNYYLAAEYSYKAANKGHPISQNNIGVINEMGWGGLKINIPQALYWYTKSAEQNNDSGIQNYQRILEQYSQRDIINMYNNIINNQKNIGLSSF